MSGHSYPLLQLFLRMQKGMQRLSSIRSARFIAGLFGSIFPLPKQVIWEKTIRGGRSNEWLIPKHGLTDRVIVYFHGGFVFPIHSPTRYLAGYLAQKTKTRVLLLDFRLAPENPFPAALEDCTSDYQWLISAGGYRPDQVIFVGESAGGNLALASMIVLRDLAISLPRGAVLISPVADFEGGSTFYSMDDPMADARFVMLQLNAYRGDTDPHHPLLSPVYADLEGLPPLLLQVGSEELLRGGVEDLASRAETAGVPTTLEIWPGMWHYWQVFVSFLPEAQQAMEQVVGFINGLP